MFMLSFDIKNEQSDFGEIDFSVKLLILMKWKFPVLFTKQLR